MTYNFLLSVGDNSDWIFTTSFSPNIFFVLKRGLQFAKLREDNILFFCRANFSVFSECFQMENVDYINAIVVVASIQDIAQMGNWLRIGNLEILLKYLHEYRTNLLTMKRLILVSLFLGLGIWVYPATPAPQKGFQLMEKSKELLTRRDFSEAGGLLEQAIKEFSTGKNTKLEIEARLLLDKAYDMLLKQTLREKNIERMFVLADDPSVSSDTLTNLIRCRWADHLLETRRAREAEQYLSTYLPHLLTGTDYHHLSRFYLLLARCHQKQFNYVGAKKTYDKALDICEMHLPDDIQYMDEVLETVSYNQVKMGHLEQGEYLIQRRIQMLEAIPEKSATDSLALATSHVMLLWRDLRAGKYAKIVKDSEQVIRMYNRISISTAEHLGVIHNGLGWALASQKRYQLAAEAFEKSVTFLQACNNKYMAEHYVMGLVGLATFTPFDPLKQNQLISTTLAVTATWKLSKSVVYSCISRIELNRGMAESALEYGILALKDYQEENEWQNSYKGIEAYSHDAIGKSYLALEQYESAIFHFHKAIRAYATDFSSEDVRDNPDQNNEFSNLWVLDMVYFKGESFKKLAAREKEKTEEFLALAHKAFVDGSLLSNKLRIVYEDPASLLKLSQRTFQIFERIVETGYELYQTTQDTTYLNAAFLASEKSKAPLLQESFAKAAAMNTAEIPEDVLAKGQMLKRELAFYQGALLQQTDGKSQPNKDLEAQVKKNIFETEQALNRWEDSIASQYPNFSQKKQTQVKIDPVTAQLALLDSSEALVEYFFSQENLYVFFVSAAETKFKRIALPINFDRQIQDFRKSIGDFASVTDSVESRFVLYTRTASQFYQLLIGPLLSDATQVSKLLIIPDGPLHHTPFEAMLTDTLQRTQINYNQLPYLILKHPIRYAHSANTLLETARRKTTMQATQCLAIAPGYDGPATRGNLASLRGGDQKLAGAQKEVEAISQLNIPGEYFFGSSATEKKFKVLAPNFNLLHLALHGYANPNEPLMSYLLFSESSLAPDTTGLAAVDSTEDNILYAHELAGIPFDADLVVLSACETGVGKFTTGEGNMSLGWYFGANGADAVVMTLWQVEDQLSADLMGKFYHNLSQSMPTGDALHNAKLSLLRSADSRTAHPYYWAGYIATGVSEPLKITAAGGPGDSGLKWWFMLLGGAGIMLVTFVTWRFLRPKGAG